MSRPTVELADIIQAQGERLLDRTPQHLSYQQLKVLRAISRCRTAALGGHIDECPRCGHEAIAYNSCRNRHCPKCQAQARQRWLTARENRSSECGQSRVARDRELSPISRRSPDLPPIGCQ